MPLANSIRKAGCERFSTNVTALSPSGTTSSRLRYQALRGLSRSLSGDFAEQHVPGAFDIGGTERLAVVPFDTLPQLEGQPDVILVPRPAFGEFRLDEFRPILLLVLLEQYEVVEDAHHRRHGRDRRLLMDRHAREVPAVTPRL